MEIPSELKNIPPDLDKKEPFFLDGLRHSAQIAEFSYQQLLPILTNLAVNRDKPLNTDFTPAFHYAWSFVDAIDRFSSLWKLQPNKYKVDSPYSPATINSRYSNVRNIRNVSDHLAQRYQYIISKN